MPENSTTDQFNFALPSQQAVSNNNSKLMTFILVLILAAVAGNILVLLKHPTFSGIESKTIQAALNSDAQKKLALKLEKQGLFTASANAWIEYLNTAGLNNNETALIWYRIGKVFQDHHAYENALDSYYRSESFARTESITADMAIRIQECLESMGKFSVMRHELSDRVSIVPAGDIDNASGVVIAEIGIQKITASELDRRMELAIEKQMTLMAPYLPEEDRNDQKENMLIQFSTPTNRQMFLNQFIVEEILYRNARETSLADDPKIRNLINDQERSLLARMVLEREYDNKIKITLSDLETFFEANKDSFVKEDKQQTFEEAKNDIYKALRSKKEQEIQQHLITYLKDQYDVVIHQTALSPKQETGDPTPSRNQK